MAKLIKAAWIEQIIEFEDEAEYRNYTDKLKYGRPQKYKIIEEQVADTGGITIRIRKQYNNNTFPED